MNDNDRKLMDLVILKLTNILRTIRTEIHEYKAVAFNQDYRKIISDLILFRGEIVTFNLNNKELGSINDKVVSKLVKLLVGGRLNNNIVYSILDFMESLVENGLLTSEDNKESNIRVYKLIMNSLINIRFEFRDTRHNSNSEMYVTYGREYYSNEVTLIKLIALISTLIKKEYMSCLNDNEICSLIETIFSILLKFSYGDHFKVIVEKEIIFIIRSIFSKIVEDYNGNHTIYVGAQHHEGLELNLKNNLTPNNTHMRSRSCDYINTRMMYTTTQKGAKRNNSFSDVKSSLKRNSFQSHDVLYHDSTEYEIHNGESTRYPPRSILNNKEDKIFDILRNKETNITNITDILNNNMENEKFGLISVLEILKFLIDLLNNSNDSVKLVGTKVLHGSLPCILTLLLRISGDESEIPLKEASNDIILFLKSNLIRNTLSIIFRSKNISLLKENLNLLVLIFGIIKIENIRAEFEVFFCYLLNTITDIISEFLVVDPKYHKRKTANSVNSRLFKKLLLINLNNDKTYNIEKLSLLFETLLQLIAGTDCFLEKLFAYFECSPMFSNIFTSFIVFIVKCLDIMSNTDTHQNTILEGPQEHDMFNIKHFIYNTSLDILLNLLSSLKVASSTLPQKQKPASLSIISPRSGIDPTKHHIDDLETPETVAIAFRSYQDLYRRKYLLTESVKLFNDGRKKDFIEILTKNGFFVEESVTFHEDIGRFLLIYPGLNKNKVGMFLCKQENDKILDGYIKYFFRYNLQEDTGKENQRIDEVLRKFLSYFKLPGESAQIERILDRFSHYFYESLIHDDKSVLNNYKKRRIFKSKESVFILSYSIAMLNTDQHNPNVKNRMTLDKFIKNNREINEGTDFPFVYLTEIFNNIKHNEIKIFGDSNYKNILDSVEICEEQRLTESSFVRFFSLKTFEEVRHLENYFNSEPVKSIVLGRNMFDACIFYTITNLVYQNLLTSFHITGSKVMLKKIAKSIFLFVQSLDRLEMELGLDNAFSGDNILGKFKIQKSAIIEWFLTDLLYVLGFGENDIEPEYGKGVFGLKKELQSRFKEDLRFNLVLQLVFFILKNNGRDIVDKKVWKIVLRFFGVLFSLELFPYCLSKMVDFVNGKISIREYFRESNGAYIRKDSHSLINTITSYLSLGSLYESIYSIPSENEGSHDIKDKKMNLENGKTQEDRFKNTENGLNTIYSHLTLDTSHNDIRESKGSKESIEYQLENICESDVLLYSELDDEIIMEIFNEFKFYDCDVIIIMLKCIYEICLTLLYEENHSGYIKKMLKNTYGESSLKLIDNTLVNEKRHILKEISFVDIRESDVVNQLVIFYLELTYEILVRNKDRIRQFWSLEFDFLYCILKYEKKDIHRIKVDIVSIMLRFFTKVIHINGMHLELSKSLELIKNLNKSTFNIIAEQLMAGLYSILCHKTNLLEDENNWTIVFLLISITIEHSKANMYSFNLLDLIVNILDQLQFSLDSKCIEDKISRIFFEIFDLLNSFLIYHSHLTHSIIEHENSHSRDYGASFDLLYKLYSRVPLLLKRYSLKNCDYWEIFVIKFFDLFLKYDYIADSNLWVRKNTFNLLQKCLLFEDMYDADFVLQFAHIHLSNVDTFISFIRSCRIFNLFQKVLMTLYNNFLSENAGSGVRNEDILIEIQYNVFNAASKLFLFHITANHILFDYEDISLIDGITCELGVIQDTSMGNCSEFFNSMKMSNVHEYKCAKKSVFLETFKMWASLISILKTFKRLDETLKESVKNIIFVLDTVIKIKIDVKNTVDIDKTQPDFSEISDKDFKHLLNLFWEFTWLHMNRLFPGLKDDFFDFGQNP